MALLLRNFIRLTTAVLLSFSLPGCGAFVAVEGASVVMTDKAASDHLVSWASGKDCSVVRTERGMTYCVEDEVRVVPEVFCYQTLGSVSCYDRPDPRRSPDQLIGQNDHNIGK